MRTTAHSHESSTSHSKAHSQAHSQAHSHALSQEHSHAHSQEHSHAHSTADAHSHPETPPRLKADLADPAGSLDPSDHLWSQWRSTALIAQGPARIARFVLDALGAAPLDVLEVGCGSGYLALELARAGHRVQALDPGEEAIDLARRTVAGCQGDREPLALAYHEADFLGWDGGTSRFDALVFNLSLHHLDDLDAAMRKAAGLLRPAGLIVVNDFVFDRLDSRTTAWLADLEAVLGLAAGDAPEHATGDAPAHATGDAPAHAAATAAANPTAAADPAAARAELAERIAGSAQEHALLGFDPLIAALRGLFDEIAFSWEPFMYTRIANRAAGLPGERHDRLVPYLAALERLCFEEGRIQSVCYRFLGRLKAS